MNFINRIVAWFKRPNKSVFTEYTEAIISIVLIAFVIRTFGFGLYQVPTCSMETTMLVGERFFADKFTVLFKKPVHGEIISFNDPNYAYSDNKLVWLWQQYAGWPFAWPAGWAGASNWTKRVIGMPGDRVKGVVENGKPEIYLKKKGESEFTKLDEPYLNKYPIVSIYTHNPADPFAFRSYDPGKKLNEQPFYRFTKSDMHLGQQRAQLIGDEAMKQPGTPTPGRYYGSSIDNFDVQLKDDQYWVMGDNRRGSYDSRVWKALPAKFIHGKIKFRIWSLDTNSSWWIVDLIKHPIDFWNRVRWSRCLEFVK